MGLRELAEAIIDLQNIEWVKLSGDGMAMIQEMKWSVVECVRVCVVYNNQQQQANRCPGRLFN